MNLLNFFIKSTLTVCSQERNKGNQQIPKKNLSPIYSLASTVNNCFKTHLELKLFNKKFEIYENEFIINEKNQKVFVETSFIMDFDKYINPISSKYCFKTREEILTLGRCHLDKTMNFQYYKLIQIIGTTYKLFPTDKIICAPHQNEISGYMCLLKLFYSKLEVKIQKTKIIQKYEKLTGNLLLNIKELFQTDIDFQNLPHLMRLITILKLLLYDHIKTNFLSLCTDQSYIYKYYMLGDPRKEGEERFMVLNKFWSAISEPDKNLTTVDIFMVSSLFKQTLKVSRFMVKLVKEQNNDIVIKDKEHLQPKYKHNLEKCLLIFKGRNNKGEFHLIYHYNISQFFCIVNKNSIIKNKSVCFY
ncbi:hypothetical protein NUSPORA_01839 [Nucleospora cyclopteri]